MALAKNRTVAPVATRAPWGDLTTCGRGIVVLRGAEVARGSVAGSTYGVTMVRWVTAGRVGEGRPVVTVAFVAAGTMTRLVLATTLVRTYANARRTPKRRGLAGVSS